ncbi:MAG: hypothetical protein R3F11_25270 [Verrucomicrobiales bacterium]
MRRRLRRVAYAIDLSFSMASSLNDRSRSELLREEVVRSLKALPDGMEFSLLYFAGPCWLQGDRPDGAAYRAGKVPKARWRFAEPTAVAIAAEDVVTQPLADREMGTDWVPVIAAALAMDPLPDAIFFATDDPCQNSKALLGYFESLGPHRVPIDAVAIGAPGSWGRSLAAVAGASGGRFGVFENGRAYLGRDAIPFMGRQFDKAGAGS